MFGINPQQLQKAKEIGKHVTAVIETNTTNHSFSVSFAAIDEEGQKLVANLAKQMATGLATQLSMMFGIKGKLVEKK